MTEIITIDCVELNKVLNSSCIFNIFKKSNKSNYNGPICREHQEQTKYHIACPL